MSFADYTSTPSGSGDTGPSPSEPNKPDYLPLEKLKKQYSDYLGTKVNEIEEQIVARRYRHGSQLTDDQRKALKKRKQPPVIYNRIGRKIDAVIGLVEKMRQDPKAYPRTPQHEQGADLATAVLHYVLDEQEWKAKSPIVAASGATDGIGGIEVIIEQGDKGDPEIGFEVVDTENFFYDPRSFRLDFSDARYMGVGKWVDVEQAKEMFPDSADEIAESLETGTDLTSNSDRDIRWIQSDQGRIRIIDHWYIRKGQWCFSIYTGALKLMEGVSYLKDEKGKTICKYLMFSGNVDQDGDRYGFVRRMKDAQDEINARRSKGLHELNTRRIIADAGAFEPMGGVEKARSEAARPDGIIITAPGMKAQFDDAAKMSALEGHIKLLQEAKDEIENFGPNPALIGQGIENKSGRAIALLQQAGVSELGPYVLAYRGWKIRVYRALWNAVQSYWTGERWVRVTDDQDVKQFIQVNGLQRDPVTGFPQMVNQLGTLDVDIILDEGADALNIMADAFDTLTLLAQQGSAIPPQVMIELAPLNGAVKKKLLQMMSQPDPAKQQAQQIAMAEAAAKVDETRSQTTLNIAKAQQAGMASTIKPVSQDDMPLPVRINQAVADINETNASAAHKNAQAKHLNTMAAMEPTKTALEVHQAQHDAAQDIIGNAIDFHQAQQPKRQPQPA